MNSEDHDMQNLRRVWIEMGKILGMKTPGDNPDRLNKMKTALDRLRDRYRRGCDWAIVGTIALTVIFLFIPWINDNYRVSLAITSALVMSANSYMMYWLWRGLMKIDPLTMSISQVSIMARHYKKCHLRYIMIGYPLAIIWVGYFMYVSSHSEFGNIEGIVIGGIIGSIFGFYGLWKDLRDFRNLSE